MNLKAIEELALKQENEWKATTSVQIKTLQEALECETKNHQELKTQFTELKQDFKYNLKLLQERDKELNALDKVHCKLKTAENSFLAEVSDLRIKIDCLKEQVRGEKQAKNELEIHYKQRIVEHQTSMDLFRTEKNNEVESAVSELRKTKRQLEHRVTQLESELESQKVELVHEFEDMMRARERDLAAKCDELKNKCLQLEMKNKIVTKELEFSNEKNLKEVKIVEESEEKAEHLRSKLHQLQLDLEDNSAFKNQRILDLEAQVEDMRTQGRKREQELEQRRQKMEQDVRMKQANLQAARQANLDREKNLEDQIRNLQVKMETCEMETKRALWDHNETRNKLQVELGAKEKEIEDLKHKLSEVLENQGKSTVAKDVEICSLKKRENILRCDNEQLQAEVEKFRDELSRAVKREEAIERSKVQLQLECKRKCEEANGAALVKGSDFTGELTRARDVAIADRERVERELHQAVEKLRVTSRELDVACDVIDRHNLRDEYEARRHVIDERGDAKGEFPASQHDLQQQNQQLKLAIKEMSEEMRRMVAAQGAEKRDFPSRDFPSRDFTDPYVESLEKEVLELKREKRRLEDSLHRGEGDARSTTTPTVSPNHPTVQTHIESLNRKIVELESDKVDLNARLQKSESNLAFHQEALRRRELDVGKLTNRVHQLEVESCAIRHRYEQQAHDQEKRMAEVSRELMEARKEADEYYRGGIRHNLREIELSGKIGQMTIDCASARPWVNDAAQGKMFQDLQDQVKELKRRLASTHMKNISLAANGHGGGNPQVVSLLREKLRHAAREIAALQEERSGLLEMANRMRSELLRHKRPPAAADDGSEQDDNADQTNKLKEMEKLQYELTKQELEFAQRRKQVSNSDEAPTDDSAEAMTSSPKPASPRPAHAKLVKITPPRRHQASSMTSSMDVANDSSIKELWKMLDDQLPSSPSVSGDVVSDVAAEGSAAATAARHVTGKRGHVTATERKSSAPERDRKKSSSSRDAASTNHSKRRDGGKSAGKKVRVRNYNLKDDSLFRLGEHRSSAG